MIHKSKINQATYLSDAWRSLILGKISSGAASSIIFDPSKELTQKVSEFAMKKAGEIITRVSKTVPDDDIYTQWGNDHEQEAIELYLTIKPPKQFMQKAIITSDEYPFVSIPDGITINPVLNDTENCRLIPVEVKCPFSHVGFMNLYRCKTPAELKESDTSYYWQVIHQLVTCGSLIAYFMSYHPEFPVKYRLIQFKATEHDVMADMNNLRVCGKHIESKINSIVSEFTQIECAESESLPAMGG